MEFRKDINGLRAIAVAAVLLFHFRPAWLPGGFAGVDVFFVISGFLITGIIVRDFKAERFSLLRFYRARVQRIVPALAVLCGVLLLGGWFYLLPLDYRTLGTHVASSLGFVSNIVYWREAGYFTADAHEKWLLHTWSLSVEWQFYLLYPLVLLVLKRCFGLPALRGWILGGCLLSLALCVFASSRWPEPSFYLLPTRAWELLLGGVACLYQPSLQRWQPRLLEAAGLALILASLVLVSSRDIWPGHLALLPALGTFAVILAARQESWITGNPLAQWLGKLSYSLYLWHWPVVVLMNYAGWLGDVSHVLAGLATSLLLAIASWRLVEQPTQRRDRPRRWRLAPLGAGVSLVLVAAGTVSATQGVVSPLRPLSQSDKAHFIEQYVERQNSLYEPYWLKCDAFSAMTQRGQPGIDPSCTARRGEGGVLLWGDSHAQALSLGLRTFLAHDEPFYQVTSASCPPALTASEQSGPIGRACRYTTQLAWDSIERLRPEVVVMAQKQGHDKTRWNDIAQRLQALGVKRIVLIGPVPQWSPSLPSVIVQRHWGQDQPYIRDPALDASLMAVDQATRAAIDPERLQFVSLLDHLCRADACLARLDQRGLLLQIDDGHLSAEGSLFVVGHYVLPYLLQ